MCENFPRVKKEHRRRRASPCAIYSLIYYFSCRSPSIHTRNFPGGFPVGSVSVSTAKLRPPRPGSLVSRGDRGDESTRGGIEKLTELRRRRLGELAGMVNDNIARFSRERTMTRVFDIETETLQMYKMKIWTELLYERRLRERKDIATVRV